MSTAGTPNPLDLSAGKSAAAPLLPVALGMIMGIVLDDAAAPPVILPIALLLIGLGLALRWRGRAGALLCGVTAAAIALGMIHHAGGQRHVPSNHIVCFTRAEPVLARVRGRVVAQPRILEPDPLVPMPFPRPPRTLFLMAAEDVEATDGAVPVQGLVRVTIREPVLLLDVGDRVEMTGWLHRPRPAQNPGTFDWAGRMRRQGILAALSCDHAAGLAVHSPGSSLAPAVLLARARARLRAFLVEDTFADSEAAAGVMSAMVLAQRSQVDRAMNDAFLRTGNAHFLAASGMNVGWLALVGWLVTRIVGMHYRLSAAVVAVLILLYVVLAEPEPSILRAGIIGLLACTAAFFGGGYSSLNALAASAVILLMLRPGDLFLPGFQLSFLATIGLLHLCPRMCASTSIWLRVRGWHRLARCFRIPGQADAILDLYEEPMSWWASAARRIGTLVCLLLAVSFSAWLITAPLSCYHFNTMNPLGWLGTFVLSPFAMVATWAGFLTVLLGLVVPSSAVVMKPLLAWSTDLMIGCVTTLAELPGGLIAGRLPSAVWLVAAYGLMATWVYRRDWMPIRHGYKLAVVLLVLWWLVPPRWVRHDDDALKVWMLAVGDGTGTVIELPDGKVLLYDFGTRSGFDAGRSGIEFLRHRGIGRIDAAFVSHPDFDHYSAIETIAREIPIDRVILNDQFEAFVEAGSAAAEFLRAVRQRGIPIEITHGRYVMPNTGEAVVETLWPPALAERRALDANEASTVLRLRYQGRSVLLTGDIEEWAIGELMRRGDISAEALALPHHGEVVGNTAAFIAAVNPRVAVRSTGRGEALTTSGIGQIAGEGRRYFNTADVGCVLVEIKNGCVCADAVMSD